MNRAPWHPMVMPTCPHANVSEVNSPDMGGVELDDEAGASVQWCRDCGALRLWRHELYVSPDEETGWEPWRLPGPKGTSAAPGPTDAAGIIEQDLASRAPALAATLGQVAKLKAPTQAVQQLLGAVEPPTTKRCTNAE